VTAGVPVDDTVAVSYSVNRAAKQIAQPVSCTLDGVATECGVQGSSSKNLTSYSRTLAGLADGPHTFAVTFTLTDGGKATSATQFVIDAAMTLEEACASLVVGGTVSSNWLWIWTCGSTLEQGLQQPGPGQAAGLFALALGAEGVEALSEYCDIEPQEVQWSGLTSPEDDALLTIQWVCVP
jgi:hypothetical protein